jgi:hypothetical protein
MKRCRFLEGEASGDSALAFIFAEDAEGQSVEPVHHWEAMEIEGLKIPAFWRSALGQI